ncbi:MAG: hypothetical protein RJA26_1106 [Actinomycetota bacterium]|jgi:hypothetical protein
MNQSELVQAWNNSWNRIIVAQMAPTALLITTVALLQFGLADAALPVRLAALLILLASGILGALAEVTAAGEAGSVASQLAVAEQGTPTSVNILNLSRWLPVVKFVTPAIFVLIFIFLAQALLLN